MVTEVPPQYCEIYLQEIDEVAKVTNREKSPHASDTREGNEGKRTILKYILSLCCSSQGLPSGETS